ncbi:MAG TPA: CBS domain-containing protein [Geminicoccus sp.]|uniref:CBS domain-containing protein n=1 Tax=Geminicoccus sp. TaxID=2024832 RepID=UPI002E32F76A|nr:CBS domain-containing protein [Geminicoccus sp.]HEX2529694.1 CBS domain-containing protein [Geminicoccus sp.]
MTDRPVRDLIERDRLVSAGPDDTVEAAVRRMAENKCGCILVLEGDRLVGIFTERDLVLRVAGAGKDLPGTRLVEVMTPEPDTIEADRPVQDAVRRMDELSYRYLPVTEGGRVIGVLSMRNLPFGTLLGMQWELDERQAVAERLW